MLRLFWEKGGVGKLRNNKTTVATTLRSGGFDMWLDSGYTFKVKLKGSAARVDLGCKRRFRLKAKVTRIAIYRMEKIVEQQTGSGKDP